MRESYQFKLRQEGSLLSWFLFPVCALVAWLSGIDQTLFWLPFVVSIVVIGLPHGAADWILLQPSTKSDGLRKFLLYSLAGAIVFAAAVFQPIAVLIGFLILTIIHFGTADERDLRRFQHQPFLSPLVRASGIFRMALFFSLVCLSDPGSVIRLMERIVQLLPGSETLTFNQSNFTTFSIILLTLGASGWVFSLGYQFCRRLQQTDEPGSNRRLEVETVEGVALMLAAFTLNPIFSVGLYFLTWHALRHSVILTGKLPDTDPPRQSIARRLVTLHFLSYPLYLPVIPLMIGILAANGSLTSAMDWVAALLIVCIIFTLPHHWIVENWLNGKTSLVPEVGKPGEPEAASLASRYTGVAVEARRAGQI